LKNKQKKKKKKKKKKNLKKKKKKKKKRKRKKEIQPREEEFFHKINYKLYDSIFFYFCFRISRDMAFTVLIPI